MCFVFQGIHKQGSLDYRFDGLPFGVGMFKGDKKGVLTKHSGTFWLVVWIDGFDLDLTPLPFDTPNQTTDWG